MADAARRHLPQKLIDQIADPGVFSEAGLFGLGPGWYHIGTSEDQIFLGHPGEADFYVLDFAVSPTGVAVSQGGDIITQFERALDGIVPLHSFAEISPGISFSTIAEGVGRQGHFDDGIDYSLVRLEFVGQEPVRIEIASLGSLRFLDIV